MMARMLSRLNRLETHPGLRPACSFRTGLLKRLPEDYFGERHVAIIEREPFSSYHAVQCEFEERPGPPPPRSDDGVPRLYLSEDEMRI